MTRFIRGHARCIARIMLGVIVVVIMLIMLLWSLNEPFFR